jgi:hypothetical protein
MNQRQSLGSDKPNPPGVGFVMGGLNLFEPKLGLFTVFILESVWFHQQTRCICVRAHGDFVNGIALDEFTPGPQLPAQALNGALDRLAKFTNFI